MKIDRPPEKESNGRVVTRGYELNPVQTDRLGRAFESTLNGEERGQLDLLDPAQYVAHTVGAISVVLVLTFLLEDFFRS